MSAALRGACLCGAVVFEVRPPYRWFAHCHCSMCRKHHGSLFSTGLGVDRRHFRWLAGEEAIVHYRATAAFERPFCGRCGSTVPAESHERDVLHVPAGLVDGDPGERPRTHIFVASKASCHSITDSLRQFAAYPPGIALPVVERPPHADDGPGIAGSCLCGAVCFASDGFSRRIVNCHCSLCRRSRAAAYGSVLLTSPQELRWTHGYDHVRSYRLPHRHTYTAAFCEL
jgi:hypothetical protein